MLKIIKKIRNKGIGWLFWRLKTELRTPTNSVVMSVIDRWLTFKRKIFKLRVDNGEDSYLYSIFDLKIAPITFNIIEFLIESEYEANRSGKKGFIVVFVPREEGERYGWEEYDSILDEESKLWRFTNIVLPITLLAPKCNGFHLLPDRSHIASFIKDREVYPPLYDGMNLRYVDTHAFLRKINRPHMVEGLRATKPGIDYIKQWKEAHNIEKPVVTITLRQYDFDQVRNSNISEWLRFVRHLQELDYFPVVIPDTDKAFETENLFPGVCMFSECAWNIGLRMALYESSYLNYFVSNGPLYLATWNNKCSYIAMNFLAEGSVIDTEDAYLKAGLKKGDNFKFALPNQRLNWNSDTYDNIVAEFERFVEDDKKNLFEEMKSDPTMNEQR